MERALGESCFLPSKGVSVSLPPWPALDTPRGHRLAGVSTRRSENPRGLPCSLLGAPQPRGPGKPPSHVQRAESWGQVQNWEIPGDTWGDPRNKNPTQQASEAALASEAGGGVHSQSRKEQTGRVKGRKGALGAEPRSQSGP